LSKKEIDEIVDNLLNKLSLMHTKYRQVRLLSGGEQRRMNIAYELIQSPNLLLLDEPTTGLSVSDARMVMNILKQFSHDGRTIISVIHQPSEDIYNLFDIIVILFRGRIVYYGPPQWSYDFFGCQKPHPDEIFTILDKYEEIIKNKSKDEKRYLSELELNYLNSQEHKQLISNRTII
jgi:ABC-type multidrug transport system ATPase subunit